MNTKKGSIRDKFLKERQEMLYPQLNAAVVGKNTGGNYSPVNVIPLTIAPLCFTEVEAAQLLVISPDDLYSLRMQNKVTYYMINGNIRYTLEDLHELLEKCKVKPKIS